MKGVPKRDKPCSGSQIAAPAFGRFAMTRAAFATILSYTQGPGSQGWIFSSHPARNRIDWRHWDVTEHASAEACLLEGKALSYHLMAGDRR